MPEENNHSQLFDNSFKLLMGLSDKAVISFINGLFGANHPLDSPVTGMNNESIKQSLWKTYKKSIKDIILKIGNEAIYHIETQIKSDAVMVTRMFQYGFDIAQKNRKRTKPGELYLKFPEQIVIYLEGGPKRAKLLATLEFPGKKIYSYEVPVLRLKDYSVKTLEERKLLLLLVFEVLKLRKQEGDRAEIARDLAQIMEEITEAIDRSVKAGLLTEEDKDSLMVVENRLTEELYDEQTIREVNMSDETAIADMVRALEAVHEKYELKRQLAEKARQLAEKDRLQQEKDEIILELKRQLEEARQLSGSKEK
ncbi:hypothetical protein FACS1894151_09460 [Spirochaetia bacterium]|nr:hypothetical protein FACS1894151_09460 [Spirochaetia bacterium]